MNLPRFTLRTLVLAILTLGLLIYLNFTPRQYEPGRNALDYYGFPVSFSIEPIKSVNFTDNSDGSSGMGILCYASNYTYWQYVVFDAAFCIVLLAVVFVVSEPRYYPVKKRTHKAANLA